MQIVHMCNLAKQRFSNLAFIQLREVTYDSGSAHWWNCKLVAYSKGQSTVYKNSEQKAKSDQSHIAKNIINVQKVGVWDLQYMYNKPRQTCLNF